MKFMKYGLTFTLLCIALSVWTQNRPNLVIDSPYKKKKAEQPKWEGSNEEACVQVVKDLFRYMYESDTAGIRSIFTKNSRLISTEYDAKGSPKVGEISLDAFLQVVGQFGKGVVKEVIYNTDVKVKDNLASIWTEYSLYANGRFIHCGVDAFQLVKNFNGWKISQIADTRNKENCPDDPYFQVGQILDKWHQAAAESDENVYFGTFTPDGIFLGTDESEKWTREEFEKWAKESFDQESAWDFKPYDREIYLYDDNKLAWFDESLKTWMGPCRGSGVLIWNGHEWKLKHYNLAILVPNAVIYDYLELIKK